jgi:subtilisin family serine protease
MWLQSNIEVPMRPFATIVLTMVCTSCIWAQSPEKKPADTTASDSYTDLDSEINAMSSMSIAPSSYFVPGSSFGAPVRFFQDQASSPEPAPSTLETIAPGRLLVVYRSGVVPANVDAITSRAQAHVINHLPLFGMSSIKVDGDTDAAIASLLAQPEVTTVLHDRYVKANTLRVYQQGGVDPKTPQQIGHISNAPIARPLLTPETDVYYESPQGWATVLSGGYGTSTPGAPASGPWNTSMGAGVRIALLDSGVDATHPDIAPNLKLNLSEVDQAAVPSVCDDGSPQDQLGHGTFAASLAAAAAGPGTGMVIGVAPQASLLNIKVIERLPSTSTSGTTTAQCEAGEGSGLLSWVIKGIQDAITNKASVISLSLGTLVDTSTGDGAGWVTQMDSVTYAAAQAGAVIIAAAGNNGINLAGSKYVDLPAQNRNVLAVVASTNPACKENLAAGATCVAGSVTRAYYSNYGSVLNAVAAPGGSLPVYSTLGVSGAVRGACTSGIAGTVEGLPATKGQSFGCFALGHTPYVQAIGTSAATPFVAGAAAILRAAHPSWTPAQVISALRSSAASSGSMSELSLNLAGALALQ